MGSAPPSAPILKFCRYGCGAYIGIDEKLYDELDQNNQCRFNNKNAHIFVSDLYEPISTESKPSYVVPIGPPGTYRLKGCNRCPFLRISTGAITDGGPCLHSDDGKHFWKPPPETYSPTESIAHASFFKGKADHDEHHEKIKTS
eukprot:UN00381